jgi:tRNA 2-thiouridine synthesizing protein A
MVEKIDARGLSCPQPVFMTQEVIWKLKTGTIEIQVDDATAKQNIKRTAKREGWGCEVKELNDDESLIILTKK